jgi:hypothetical protein
MKAKLLAVILLIATLLLNSCTSAPSAGMPAGTIQLWKRTDPYTEQAIAGCQGNLSMYGWGQVFCVTKSLPSGQNLISAIYSGDVNHDPGQTDSEYSPIVYPETTVCRSKPGTSVPTSPDNQADVDTLRVPLDWEDTACALLYEVHVRHNRPNGVIADLGLTWSSDFITRRLLPGRYYWQVRACNRSGCSGWSEFRILRRASQESPGSSNITALLGI